MDVTNSHGWARHRWRLPLGALMVLGLATFAGSAQAVEFDASVRAPLMKDAGELKAQAQEFSTRYNAVREARPEQLVKDASLARDQFDLIWKVERAIDERRPLDELAPLGLVSDANGVVNIDFNAYPLWNPYHEQLASLLPRTDPEMLRKELTGRGFRTTDITTMEAYLATHDLDRAKAEGVLPVALSFSKIIRKYDKLKRPIDQGLLLSYVYQRSKVASETTREWAAGLLQSLDAQRARILFEYLADFKSTGIWTPSPLSDALADILATMRRPDFEQQAIAEAKGVHP